MAFNITIRTVSATRRYTAVAESAADAFRTAGEAHGDEPCGITVTPAGNLS